MAFVSNENLREWARTDLDELRYDLAGWIELAETFLCRGDEEKALIRGELERLGEKVCSQATEVDARLFLYVDFPLGVWPDEIAFHVSDAENATKSGDIEGVDRAIELLRRKIADVESSQRQICGPEFQQSPVGAPLRSAESSYHKGAIGLCVHMLNLANWEEKPLIKFGTKWHGNRIQLEATAHLGIILTPLLPHHFSITSPHR